MPYIISMWKPTGAYTIKDSINGKKYKSLKTAERIAEKIMPLTYVVRKI